MRAKTNSVTLMTWFLIEQNGLAGDGQGSTLNQTQYTIAIDLRNSIESTLQYSNCSPKTEPKVVKKFKTISSNLISIWLNRNQI